GFAQEKKTPIFLSSDGKLQYTPDSLGNQIPDFSYAGYQAGNKPIPAAKIKIVVPVKSGDATQRSQAAIDYVSQLPLDKDNLRGAVLLEQGIYPVAGSLKLHTSGVVLRGAGFTENGTVIIGEGVTRETLIRITGKSDIIRSEKRDVIADYVPVNAMSLEIENAIDY